MILKGAPVDKVAQLFNLDADELAIAELGEWQNFDVTLTEVAYHEIVNLLNTRDETLKRQKQMEEAHDFVKRLRNIANLIDKSIRLNDSPLDPELPILLFTGDILQVNRWVNENNVKPNQVIRVSSPNRIAGFNYTNSQIRFTGTWSADYPIFMLEFLLKRWWEE